MKLRAYQHAALITATVTIAVLLVGIGAIAVYENTVPFSHLWGN